MLYFHSAWWLLLASLRVICGSLNGMCGGNLTSMSGGSIPAYYSWYLGYGLNEQCDWHIIPETENFSVLIRFTMMEIEPGCCDHLAIYANPPTYTTLVGLFNGSRVPYDMLYDGPLRLHFESDEVGTFSYGGFHLYYDIYPGLAPRFVSVTNDTNVVVQGDEVLLPCHVTGFPLPVVTWYKDGLDVHSILRSKFIFQGNDLLLKGVVEEDSGVFKCKAENYLNSTEQVFQLHVQVPPIVLTHPTSIHFENVFDNITDYSGSGYSSSSDYDYDYNRGHHNELPAVFRCDVSGTPRPMVYWKKDGRILLNPLIQYDWLVIIHVTASDEGNYSCFANNSVGSAESRTASLTIGEVLTCCFSSNNIVKDYYSYPRYLGDALSLDFKFRYGTYTVSNMTVTRDIGDQRLQLKNIRVSFRSKSRISVALGSATATYIDSGVYGCHLILSRSTSNSTDTNTSIPVSFYVPIFVTVPPLVTVSPSKVFLRDPDERLDIACSVSFAYSQYMWIAWYKNDTLTHWQRIAVDGLSVYRSYLRVSNTFDDVEVRHYTCSVHDNYRSNRATVSVVTRVKQGGWSWWTETLPCSETCGSNRGIRLRSRHCYNNNIRCSGYSTGQMQCYPSQRYCHADTSTPRSPVAANYSIVLSTTSWPRTTETSAEFDDSSQTVSVATAAAISCVVTGIVAVAVTAILMYFLMRRNYRKELEFLQSHVTTTSPVDSHRYVSTELKFRKPSKKAADEPSSKYVSTEPKGRTPSKKAAARPSTKEQGKKPKSVSVKYSKDDDQVYEPVDASENYTPMLQLDSQNANDEKYPAETPDSGYLQPVSLGKSLGRTDAFYIPMAPQLEEDTVYSNVPNPRDEEVYANQ